MSDTLTIPQRREAYRQKMADLAQQIACPVGNAKIKQFMETVLAELRRRYSLRDRPDVKMQWREREKQEDLLPSRQPELVLRVRLKSDDWYFAINERDILTADNYDKFLAYNVAHLVALIDRETGKASGESHGDVLPFR